MEQRYLGDGLYATFDGYHIWLWAERDGRRHEVALEPAVYRALVTYHDTLVAKLQTGRERKA
jgi:hypothetical protein